MIRLFLAMFASADEVAELRDRAVTDAATVDRLRFEAEVDAITITDLRARIAAMRRHPTNNDNNKDTNS